MASKNKVKSSILSLNQINRIKVLVFGHKEFSQLFGTLIDAYSDIADFHMVDAIVGSIIEVNEHIQQIQPDVVISAGSNAAYLKTNIDTPVIALPVSDADIIAATSKAAKVCKKIKLITYDPHYNLLPLLETALNVSIEHHTYATAKLAREQFYLLQTDDNTAVVGASLVCDLAAQNGIKSFMYYSRQSCKDAIEAAISIAKASYRQNIEGTLSSWLIAHQTIPVVYVDLSRRSVLVSRGASEQFELSVTCNEDFEQACLQFVTQYLSQLSEQTLKQGLSFRGRLYATEITLTKNSKSVLLSFETEHQLPAKVSIAEQDIVRQTGGLLRFKSDAMAKVLKKVSYFAVSASNVLITGESGTGKELIARSIHAASAYANGPFVALNCSAIPTELFEGELFGHTQGAYTGSRKGGRKGLIHEAQKGVLFLDEVSELSFEQQAKILRFLQERCYRQVGGNQEISSDIKVVAATNKPLHELIERGTFRHDLFYRLNVLNISIPALRNRREDICCIAKHKLSLLFSRNAIRLDATTIVDDIEEIITNYPWPGNVRELENILERLCASLLMVDGAESMSSILYDVAPELATPVKLESDSLIVAKQLEMVARAMDMFNGDKQQVADYLGMSQTTLWRRLKKLNLQHNHNKPHPLGDKHAEF